MQSSFSKELTLSIVICIICQVVFGVIFAFVADNFLQMNPMVGKNKHFIPMVVIPMISGLIARQFLVHNINDIPFAVSFFFCILVLNVVSMLVVGIGFDDIKVVIGVPVSALVSAYILYSGDH